MKLFSSVNREQVCALFNARANVGEARFMCPLCRLRGVNTKPSTAVGAGGEAASVAQVSIGCWISGGCIVTEGLIHDHEEVEYGNIFIRD